MAGTLIKWFCLAGIAALFTGCDLMKSSDLEMGLSSVGSTCDSNLGAYQLPRRLVNVTVADGSEGRFSIEVVPGKYVADGEATYCLDFLFAGFAEDRVGVEREDMLLKRVFTQTRDKSIEIATQLFQAGADLVSTRGASRSSLFRKNLDVGEKTVHRVFEFDPMKEADARLVNKALRPFGYCIYLKKFGDPFVPDWAEGMCENLNLYKSALASALPASYVPSQTWKTTLKPSSHEIIVRKPIPRSVQRRGILYRPRLTHSMIIMRQDNPGIPGSPWIRAGSERLQLPNAAPHFLLEVKRALFVDAETDIKFHKGMLQSVALHKPSELQALTTGVVVAVKIVTKIPATALKIIHNRASNEIKLIELNQQLIKTQQEHNRIRGIVAPQSRPPPAAPGGGNSTFDQCINLCGVDDQDCKTACAQKAGLLPQ